MHGGDEPDRGRGQDRDQDRGRDQARDQDRVPDPVVEPLQPNDPREIGGYRLLGRLGAGGMGRVHLARSPEGRPVAVKVVHESHATDREFRSRFRREVAAARRVGERWTASVLEADPEAARPWVATEYVPGPSLDRAVGDHGPLPPRSLRALASALLLALRGIHGVGVVHRDLKPSNVLLALDGPRVIDFGIARALQGPVESLRTRTGDILGSPGFMAPEQIQGGTVTPAVDVFALGSVLAYAAAGRVPFGSSAETNALAVMYAVASEPPDLSDLEESGLRDMVARCLAKRPEDRPAVPALIAELESAWPQAYETGATGGPWLPAPLIADLERRTAALREIGTEAAGAAEPAEAPLEAKVAGTPVEPASPPRDTTTRQRPRRRTVLAAVAAVTAVALLGGGAAFWMDRERSENDRARDRTAPSATSPSSPPSGTASSGGSASPKDKDGGAPGAGEGERDGKHTSAPGAGDKENGTGTGTGPGSGDSGPRPKPTDGDGGDDGDGSGGGGGGGDGDSVPASFRGTWTRSQADSGAEPGEVTVHGAAPGEQAVTLVRDTAEQHCEARAPLTSVEDGGKRVVVGASDVVEERSHGPCRDGGASSFTLRGGKLYRAFVNGQGSTHPYARAS